MMFKWTEESHEENFLQITSLGVEKGFSKFEGKLAVYVAFTVTSFVCQMRRFLPNYLDNTSWSIKLLSTKQWYVGCRYILLLIMKENILFLFRSHWCGVEIKWLEWILRTTWNELRNWFRSWEFYLSLNERLHVHASFNRKHFGGGEKGVVRL